VKKGREGNEKHLSTKCKLRKKHGKHMHSKLMATI
jgi:hypothetical protein